MDSFPFQKNSLHIVPVVIEIVEFEYKRSATDVPAFCFDFRWELFITGFKAFRIWKLSTVESV